ncbi:hypothetical protein G7046_g3636 [Stylonectria norvegica]|nr:hypothetical protein G7046_g3636 [Stylonectria norvegica]
MTEHDTQPHGNTARERKEPSKEDSKHLLQINYAKQHNEQNNSKNSAVAKTRTSFSSDFYFVERPQIGVLTPIRLWHMGGSATNDVNTGSTAHDARYHFLGSAPRNMEGAGHRRAILRGTDEFDDRGECAAISRSHAPSSIAHNPASGRSDAFGLLSRHLCGHHHAFWLSGRMHCVTVNGRRGQHRLTELQALDAPPVRQDKQRPASSSNASPLQRKPAGVSLPQRRVIHGS